MMLRRTALMTFSILFAIALLFMGSGCSKYTTGVSGNSPDTRSSGTTVEMAITDYGKIVIELNDMEAPITVDNFLRYVDEEFYDGLIFHRVIDDFMIQGGGFYPDMTQKDATYAPIVNEAETAALSNVRGTIAMARASDPDSATTQFFINTVDNPSLDPGGSSGEGYCVFGRVTSGMSVVDAISAVATHSESGHQDVPVDDVIIEQMVVTEEAVVNEEDRDEDGLPNEWESNWGLDPDDDTGDNGHNGDPDGDGAENWWEYENNTDPLNEDTDGDGHPDGDDEYPNDASRWGTVTDDDEEEEEEEETSQSDSGISPVVVIIIAAIILLVAIGVVAIILVRVLKNSEEP